jgi:hypothetical protein
MPLLGQTVELALDSFGEEDKTLTTASDETIFYNTLIIATAARVLKLDEFGVTGADAKNVCYLRDVQDAAHLMDVIAALKGSAVDARVVERRAGAGQGRGGVAEFSVRASGEERRENFGQDPEWSEKIPAAIVEVILKNLLKQKKEGSAVDKLNVRLKAVALLGRLFALPGRQFAQEYPLVFAEFLKRFSDKVVDVRVAVVNCAKAFMEANPSGEQASEILGE